MSPNPEYYPPKSGFKSGRCLKSFMGLRNEEASLSVLSLSHKTASLTQSNEHFLPGKHASAYQAFVDKKYQLMKTCNPYATKVKKRGLEHVQRIPLKTGFCSPGSMARGFLTCLGTGQRQCKQAKDSGKCLPPANDYASTESPDILKIINSFSGAKSAFLNSCSSDLAQCVFLHSTERRTVFQLL